MYSHINRPGKPSGSNRISKGVCALQDMKSNSSKNPESNYSSRFPAQQITLTILLFILAIAL